MHSNHLLIRPQNDFVLRISSTGKTCQLSRRHEKEYLITIVKSLSNESSNFHDWLRSNSCNRERIFMPSYKLHNHAKQFVFFLSPLQLFHQLEYFFHLHILLPDLFSLIGFTLRIPNSSRTKTPIYNTISHTLRLLTTLSPDSEVERRKEEEIWRRVFFFFFLSL